MFPSDMKDPPTIDEIEDLYQSIPEGPRRDVLCRLIRQRDYMRNAISEIAVDMERELRFIKEKTK
jgi:hypothetical protein